MKILLIEDDEQLAELVCLNLKSQNYAVELATDGQLGLELAEAANPDAIVIDGYLPRLDGMELCKRLRAHGNGVPILMLTSRNEEADKIKGLDAGADDYLTKPFSLNELSARLRALLRRGGNSVGTPIVKWGPLSLTPATCEVLYGDRLVSLRPKEYALLELFMRNPNQLFSRDKILDRLWTFDDAPNEETVKAHIKGLRQHLKQAGAPAKLIESIYGMGYRLNPQYKQVEAGVPNHSVPSAAAATITPTLTDPVQSPPTVTRSGPVAQAPVGIPVWEQMKPKMLERVAAVATAVQAMEAGTPQESLDRAGCREAHKLAGILGTLGFDRGTALARQIEVQLKDPNPLPIRLRQLLDDLERELEKEPKPETMAELMALTQGGETQPAPADLAQPLELLLVGANIEISTLLVREGKDRRVRCTHVLDADSARRQIELSTPHVLAIAAEGMSATFQLLAQMAAQVATIPTLVVTEAIDLSNRVALARLGVKRVLETPADNASLFSAIDTIGQQNHSRNPRILAVDDDPEFTDILRGILPPSGFDVTAVENAELAWEELASLNPDLILLDVEMPAIDGIELCQALRSDERYWGTPVLILASVQNTARVQQAFIAGADGFVKKPVIATELIAQISTHLERRTFGRA